MNKLVFLCGLPASGKSTIAENYKKNGYVVLSSDNMRERLFGGVSNQDCNAELFVKLYRIAREMLAIGKDVVIDATNISSKRRIHGLESILKNTKKDKIQLDRGCIHVSAEIVACPYNECIDRNKARDRKVPNSVIEGMYKSWQTPMEQEGFDEVRLTYTSNTVLNSLKTIEFLKKFPQFNSNHTLTIGNHCQSVASKLRSVKNKNLQQAGLLHDIGKLFCMSFKDSHGRLSNEAHFYSHESVSAYDSLFHNREWYQNISDGDRLEVSQLITWHMLLHRLDNEKSIEKYKKFFGEEFWSDLMLLHEADKKGR